jgi:hypothetical protein
MQEMAIRAGQARFRDRLAAAFLLAVLALGTLVLWIGIPVACLWGASKVTHSIGGHFLVATPLTLFSMGVFVWGLYAVDRLYLRVTGAWDLQPDDDYEDDEEVPQAPRGPLEPMLIASLVVGIVALFVWFFVFAENPSPQVI